MILRYSPLHPQQHWYYKLALPQLCFSLQMWESLVLAFAKEMLYQLNDPHNSSIHSSCFYYKNVVLYCFLTLEISLPSCWKSLNQAILHCIAWQDLPSCSRGTGLTAQWLKVIWTNLYMAFSGITGTQNTLNIHCDIKMTTFYHH